jgi:hypothetical protein
MKTPMQILISELEDGLKQDEIKVSPKELLQNLIWRCSGLLEKEKEVMCEFAFRFNHDAFTENYIKAEFEETFNNK